MKRKKSKKSDVRARNAQSYESSLTPKALEKYHDLLFSGKSLRQMRAASPRWGKGKHQGELPVLATVQRSRARFRLDAMLLELDETTRLMEGTRKKLNRLLKGTESEKVIDQAMALIGQEVIFLTLRGINPTMRNASARLLLKRADQRRVDRRLDLVEGTLREDEPQEQTGSGMTPDEKQERIRQILGTE